MKLLEADTPGKVGGPPGNAFELVYEGVADKIWQKLHGADPVLAEYIRLHLYGDVYSSPGLEMRQKQLLMIAFLGEANMHEQLFGHALAALRFGNDAEACVKALDIGFEFSPCPSNDVYKSGLETLGLAHKKFSKAATDMQEKVVAIPDGASILIPTLYQQPSRTLQARKQGGDSSARKEEAAATKE